MKKAMRFALAALVAMALVFPSQAIAQDKPCPSCGVYSVVVDYGQPCRDMIDAGYYDYVSVFTYGGYFSYWGRGKVQTSLRLIEVNRSGFGTAEFLKELTQQGMRPATIAELLAFGAAYPSVQREKDVYALGSIYRESLTTRYIPKLGVEDSERRLDVEKDGPDIWNKPAYFLVVKI